MRFLINLLLGVDRPSGKYVMEDLHKAGGIPGLVKYLLKNTDLIDGTQLTVTGKTIAENYEDAPELDFSAQQVIRPLDNPIKEVSMRRIFLIDGGCRY